MENYLKHQLSFGSIMWIYMDNSCLLFGWYSGSFGGKYSNNFFIKLLKICKKQYSHTVICGINEYRAMSFDRESQYR